VGGFQARLTTDVREEGARAEVVDLRDSRPLVLKDRQHLDSLDEAKPHTETIREPANRCEHHHISEGSHSPWGKLQGHEPVAVGIDAT
jgi:hypothetical protein